MELNCIRMQISEFLADNEITVKIGDSKTSMRVYKKLLKIFDEVEDVRIEGKICYKLNELLLMIFLAILSGCDSNTEIELFWTHQKIYKKLFKRDEIPSHDTFRRVMSIIKPENMNQAIRDVMGQVDSSLRKTLGLPAPKKRQICIDGKQLRSTGRSNCEKGHINDLQILNVFDSGSETCLYSEAIQDKTNEIPHAQSILKEMDLNDTVVTFDALHTQIKTIEIIAGNKGDYVGGLKGNQKTLNEIASNIFNIEQLQTIKGTENYYKTSEVSHNQLEERHFYLYPLPARLKKNLFSQWKKIFGLVCYHKHIVNNVTGKTSDEVRYYITSLKNINDIAQCIRGHWGVENKLHWSLDTVMYEDFLSITDRTAALNRSIINKICVSLYTRLQELKSEGKKEKPSKKVLRKMFGWNFSDMVREMLLLLDPEALQECLTIVPRKKK